MRNPLSAAFLALAIATMTRSPVPARRPDWLTAPPAATATARVSRDGREIGLENGLIRRAFRLQPNAATIAYDNLMTGTSILRGVKPEAILELNGAHYDVGGLLGQPDYAYLRRSWIGKMTADPRAFRFLSYRTGKTRARFAWRPRRYSEQRPWPPPGVSLDLDFAPPEGELPGLIVTIHYEMYDGVPVLAKWLTLHNGGASPVELNALTTEVLAAADYGSTPGSQGGWHHPNLYVDSDYAFNGTGPFDANKVAHWVPDPQYTTQVDYTRQAPVLLQCRPPIGPDVIVQPGGEFESFRVFELVYDTYDRERQGLEVRRMYRTLAPWVTENPIMMHVIASDPERVKAAIDQAAAVGFEMVILSFGSGLDMENVDPDYMARVKELVDYAHSKGVGLGGYSLLASRSIDAQDDVIDPKTGKPGGAIFGSSPCLCSKWGEEYFRKLERFLSTTGMDLLENDGSYPGDVCASTTHPGHRGLRDSQWMQWKAITRFYQWCRSHDIYLNVPDWYFLSGSNKTGMGYREDNWSLPRDRQILLGRQNIFDGTWYKTPSMGWMFVPLMQYHGGGAAATLEPLAKHLGAYSAHLAQNFGSGVQAAYRGLRLYDTPQTEALGKKWVDFYKRHRSILDSDIVHVRRADGRNIDCMLHVNAALKEKGLAEVFNPTSRAVTTLLTLPLYYTGLTTGARVTVEDGRPTRYTLDRQYDIRVPLTVPAHGMTWVVIR